MTTQMQVHTSNLIQKNQSKSKTAGLFDCGRCNRSFSYVGWQHGLRIPGGAIGGIIGGATGEGIGHLVGKLVLGNGAAISSKLDDAQLPEKEIEFPYAKRILL